MLDKRINESIRGDERQPNNITHDKTRDVAMVRSESE